MIAIKVRIYKAGRIPALRRQTCMNSGATALGSSVATSLPKLEETKGNASGGTSGGGGQWVGQIDDSFFRTSPRFALQFKVCRCQLLFRPQRQNSLGGSRVSNVFAAPRLLYRRNHRCVFKLLLLFCHPPVMLLSVTRNAGVAGLALCCARTGWPT